jgi:hypothetical protein
MALLQAFRMLSDNRRNHRRSRLRVTCTKYRLNLKNLLMILKHKQFLLNVVVVVMRRIWANAWFRSATLLLIKGRKQRTVQNQIKRYLLPSFVVIIKIKLLYRHCNRLLGNAGRIGDLRKSFKQVFLTICNLDGGFYASIYYLDRRQILDAYRLSISSR